MRSAENWSVTVWGTRGAVPVAEAAFLEYGGNTSCLSVRRGGELVIFDAGSGIIRLGNELTQHGGPKRLHILVSHLHLDHIQGLMGFQPLYDPAVDIHLYGEARDGVSFRAQLDRVFGPPYWPLGLDDCRAKLTVHEIGPDTQFFPAEGLSVRTLRSCHPNQSLIYRLDGQDRSVVYTLDCELSDGIIPLLTDFARGCDLLIWDANFTEADQQKGWGHSTWEQGLDMARAAGAARVLMTHYDRKYTDAFLQEQEQLAKQQSDMCIFAREKMEVVL